MKTSQDTHHNAINLPRIEQQEASSGLRLVISGDWTIEHIGILERQISDVVALRKAPEMPAIGTMDAVGLTSIDTAGAWLLEQVIKRTAVNGCTLTVAGLNSAQQELLSEVARAGSAERSTAVRPGWVAAAGADIGRAIQNTWKDLRELISFFGRFVAALIGVLTFQCRFRWTPFVHHLDHAGLRAVPIIALICFLIGAVVMQQGAVQLSAYGAEPYAASMLGVLALREIGVLLTAVMVAGRSASAFTAEIGSMKMREEIDAMRTLGIDPVETLVLPRIMALLVALPLLTFVGNMMCLAGGAVVAVFYLDQPLVTFLERLQEAAEPRHFIAGMIKTPFAALVIGLVGCLEGLKVSGSAESLGQHVTSAVVKAIFLVIILGALFAMFLVSIGV
ncbi:MAG TPA: MlaE family lipid ABC transporter permease subunit [Hyphomicrobiaceae bacterium]|nr:MlaE family lipid ABC transporter permease subunit [Hyphomicrobiaceae bacterium]